MNVGQSKRMKALDEPGRPSLFSKRRRRDSDHLQKPPAKLRLMKVQPVKGSVNSGESSQIGDALMGGCGHSFLEG
jgi:hypothetical protein